MKIMISPSLACCDWMQIGKEICILKDAGADTIHIDIQDLSFTSETMFPISVLPRLNEYAGIPLDIHMMTRDIDKYMEGLLSQGRGNYITLHQESTQNIFSYLTDLKRAGAHVGLALNIGTPLVCLEDYIPMLDLVLLINGVGGVRMNNKINEVMERRISNTRKMLDEAGKENVWVSVDGHISIDNALRARNAGANMYVLGTSSIYGQSCSVEDSMRHFRMEIESKDELYKKSIMRGEI